MAGRLLARAISLEEWSRDFCPELFPAARLLREEIAQQKSKPAKILQFKERRKTRKESDQTVK